MANEDLIRELVAKACRESLKQKSQELTEDIARRASAALASQPLQTAQTKELRDGARTIAGSRTQTETLESLLTAVSAITPACGLMILRGTQASGWGCHGLATSESFKRATMDCSRGVAATVISSCTARAAQVSELDPAFAAALGLGGSAQLLLVPVLLKERVAALLIALPRQRDDLAGLELLGQVAELTLDLQTYRKTPPVRPTATPYPVAEPAKPEPPPQVNAASASAGTYIASTAPATQITAPAVQPTQATQPALDESQEKARRFAKLLVEEIKLYNQTKLAEGRARGDIYSRLRDDIEKSRGAYEKRYGESLNNNNFFNQELMRILADNNRAAMGPGFPG